MEAESKVCTKCDKLKPLTEYHWKYSTHLKRKAACIVCESAYAKEYQRKIAARTKKAKLAAQVRESKSKASEFDTIDMTATIQGLTLAIGNAEIARRTGLTYEDLIAIQNGVFLKIQRLLNLHEIYCHDDHNEQLLTIKAHQWE